MINGAEDVRKRGPSRTAGGTVNWYSHWHSTDNSQKLENVKKKKKRKCGVCICIVKYYSVIKKEILPFAGLDKS